jgi:hypothetical protein
VNDAAEAALARYEKLADSEGATMADENTIARLQGEAWREYVALRETDPPTAVRAPAEPTACLSCGAVIADPALHEAWHERVRVRPGDLAAAVALDQARKAHR